MIVNGVEKTAAAAYDSAGISGRKTDIRCTRRHGAKRQHTAESIFCRNDAGRWRYIGNSKFCRRWLIYG